MKTIASPNGTLTATTGQTLERVGHETAGTWAPDGWRPPSIAGQSQITFFRMDTPALAAISYAFSDGGAHMYGDRMVAGQVAVYGVLVVENMPGEIKVDGREPLATVYQVAIHRDAAGVVHAAYPHAVGPMVLPAPQAVQDAFHQFVDSFQRPAQVDADL